MITKEDLNKFDEEMPESLPYCNTKLLARAVDSLEHIALACEKQLEQTELLIRYVRRLW